LKIHLFDDYLESYYFKRYLQWKYLERAPVSEKLFRFYSYLGLGTFGPVSALWTKCHWILMCRHFWKVISECYFSGTKSEIGSDKHHTHYCMIFSCFVREKIYLKGLVASLWNGVYSRCIYTKISKCFYMPVCLSENGKWTPQFRSYCAFKIYTWINAIRCITYAHT